MNRKSTLISAFCIFWNNFQSSSSQFEGVQSKAGKTLRSIVASDSLECTVVQIQELNYSNFSDEDQQNIPLYCSLSFKSLRATMKVDFMWAFTFCFTRQKLHRQVFINHWLCLASSPLPGSIAEGLTLKVCFLGSGWVFTSSVKQLKTNCKWLIQVCSQNQMSSVLHIPPGTPEYAYDLTFPGQGRGLGSQGHGHVHTWRVREWVWPITHHLLGDAQMLLSHEPFYDEEVKWRAME